MRCRVVVKLSLAGLHHWKECDIEHKLYLRELHRHVFYLRIEKTVAHDDRDIEIIALKEQITEYLECKYFDIHHRCLNFGTMSCEQIALDVMHEFSCDAVEVLEDNENGAIVYA